jgi:lipopolysaccharide transport system ATP-binding protein
MSKPIIQVENLGKRYQVKHQTGERYTALRDVLVRGAKRLFSGAKDNNQNFTSEDFWALKDVSFRVNEGEVVGIIGKNGAGKSTLLKILSRITEPTTGRIHIGGRVASLLEVGTGFHPELTGRENIYLNGAILGMTKAEIRRKFDEIVAFAEVEQFLDTPVKRYSSGMYVRLAFAVAAHLEPEILVVDEVLAVGDAEFQKKCLGKMQEVSQGGRTVLFVSHNINAIRNLCSRVLLISKGEMIQDGNPEEAFALYSSSSVHDADLNWIRPDNLPHPAMAFKSITATLEGNQPCLRFKSDIVFEGRVSSPPVFIAVDICDSYQVPIMQALPKGEPFIACNLGEQHARIEIDLPPLVPGSYTADFWIGSHYTATMDYVKNVIKFNIDESPTVGRGYPHSPAHGFLVPMSHFELLPS